MEIEDLDTSKLTDPVFLQNSYVSPRKRAQKTLELLYLGCRVKLPWQEQREHGDEDIRTEANVEITEDIREWDYGDYEGITSPQIRELRKKQGIGGPNGEWDIWKEGCPGGEYVLISLSSLKSWALWDRKKFGDLMKRQC